MSVKRRGTRLTGIWKDPLARQLCVWGHIWEPKPEARDESERTWAPRVPAVPGASVHQAAQTTPDEGHP